MKMEHGHEIGPVVNASKAAGSRSVFGCWKLQDLQAWNLPARMVNSWLVHEGNNTSGQD